MTAQAKARIGVIMPARQPGAHIVSGSGIVGAEVCDAVVRALGADARVAEVVTVSLDHAYVLNGKVHAQGHCLSDLDAVLWLYYVGGHAAQWEILQVLAQQTRVLPDPAAAARARNKYHAHAALRGAGLPTTDFCVFNAADAEDMAPVLAQWGEVLIKPVLGDFGQGICKTGDMRVLVDTVGYAQSFSDKPLQILCERFEPNDISKWISATVINGEVVFGYRKRDSAFVDGWKVYDAGRVGGNADYADAAPVAEVAARAARALGCDIVGFDFIYATRTQSYMIVDENTLPGMYADCFAAAGKGSLADHLAALVLANL